MTHYGRAFHRRITTGLVSVLPSLSPHRRFRSRAVADTDPKIAMGRRN